MRMIGPCTAAVLIGVTLAILAANPELVPNMLALLGFVAAPIILLSMVRHALKAGRPAPAAELHASEDRLRNLRERLARAEAECQALSRQVKALEVETPVPTRRVVLEAERIARIAASRPHRDR